MQDPFGYDQAGRNFIDQQHIFDRYFGEEQKEKLKEALKEALKEFPSNGGRIMDKAAKEGYADVIVALLQLGANPMEKGGGEGNEREGEKGDEEEENEEELGSD